MPSAHRDVVTKVGKGIGGVLGKILPSSSSKVEVVDKRVEMEKAMQQRGNELGRELFGGGLMGRMAGGLIGMAAKQMGAANARLMAVQVLVWWLSLRGIALLDYIEPHVC